MPQDGAQLLGPRVCDTCWYVCNYIYNLGYLLTDATYRRMLATLVIHYTTQKQKKQHDPQENASIILASPLKMTRSTLACCER